jgi:nicotinate-nucleotide adenylyltransferase
MQLTISACDIETRRGDLEASPLLTLSCTGPEAIDQQRQRPRLYRPGANHAADSVVIRNNPESGELEVLCIQRKNGQWAIPGGFVDLASSPENQESHLTAALRELSEEAMPMTNSFRDTLRARAQMIYSGVVRDPRNSFEDIKIGEQTFPARWIESTAFLVKLNESESQNLRLASQDLEETQSQRWIPVCSDEISELYADHPKLVRIAVQSLQNNQTLDHEPLLPDYAAIQDLGFSRIAIFGGTFDPPHIGHMKAAQLLLQSNSADCVIFVPAGQNPLKQAKPEATAWERTQMLRSMCMEDLRLYVCPAEALKSSLLGGASYTIDMLQDLHAAISPTQKIKLLLGSDVVQALPSFKRANEIERYCEILSLERPGVPPVSTLKYTAIPDSGATLIEISASTIREKIKQQPDASISGLHPEVARYIHANNLYEE